MEKHEFEHRSFSKADHSAQLQTLRLATQMSKWVVFLQTILYKIKIFALDLVEKSYGEKKIESRDESKLKEQKSGNLRLPEIRTQNEKVKL